MDQPLVTPQKIFPDKNYLRDYGCKIAFIFFRPEYIIIEEQYHSRILVHVPPSNMKISSCDKIKYVVISEVYGGPVTATTMEELAYYGIETVIGFGYVGSFNFDLSIGDNIIVSSALSEKGTTPHYSSAKFAFPCPFYYELLKDEFKSVISWTTNVLYREYTKDIEKVLLEGCSVVNMETSHFYACAEKLGIKAIYFATVSDFLGSDWKISLGCSIRGLTTPLDEATDKLLNSVFSSLPFLLILNRIDKLYKENKICPSHSIFHCVEVMKHAEKALKDISISNREKKCVLLACLLHDVDDNKFFSEKGYPNLTNILSQENYSIQDMDLVVKMVKYVSSSGNGDNIPEEIGDNLWMLYPRFADRLEALGKIGIFRCWQYTKTKGSPLYTENTPKALSEKHLWSDIATEERYKNYKGNSESMIDHYYDKLLRLGNFPTNNKYFNDIKKERNKEMIKVVMDFSSNGYITDDYFSNFY